MERNLVLRHWLPTLKRKVSMLKQVPWIRAGSHHHEAFYGGIWYPSAGRNTPNQRGGSRRSSPCHHTTTGYPCGLNACAPQIIYHVQQYRTYHAISNVYGIGVYFCAWISLSCNQSPSANFVCRVLFTTHGFNRSS
jgi:hypothetical protein